MKNLFLVLFCGIVLTCVYVGFSVPLGEQLKLWHELCPPHPKDVTMKSDNEKSARELFLNHPLYNCIQCLCHARTGCWRRQNCARYSISVGYWQAAGSLSVGGGCGGCDSDYWKCMQDENCIVGTIIQYTEKFGQLDSNCDGKFDCKDRFAIHLFGEKCANPKFNATYSRRFNECASRIGVNEMLPEEGYAGCNAPPVE